MRVLIDVGHPAHVHLFKNVARMLLTEGHTVLFTCRERDNVIYLLKYYGFDVRNLGKQRISIAGKLLNLVLINVAMLFASMKYKPDLYLSNGSMFAALSAFIFRKPHIIHEDTGNMEQMLFYLPFARYILTPDTLQVDLGKKQFRYRGFQESFYLHKNYFQPDESVLLKYNVTPDMSYLLLRFVNYNASHDIGYNTLKPEQINSLVRRLSKDYTLFISHEGGIPDNLKSFGKWFDPQDVHSLMAFSKGYIGQSATMASEASHLGVPSIFIRAKNEKTEGVIDYLNSRGFIKTIDYTDHQIDDIIDGFYEIAETLVLDIQEEICDPTRLLYSAIFNPEKYWEV